MSSPEFSVASCHTLSDLDPFRRLWSVAFQLSETLFESRSRDPPFQVVWALTEVHMAGFSLIQVNGTNSDRWV